MKIYVASSWRNEQHYEVVCALRNAGHDVYDFKASDAGFDWKQISPDFEKWTASQTIDAYSDELAKHGLAGDFASMRGCDALVAVQPYGCDASLELGWAIGAGKKTCVLMSDAQKPGLMTRLADDLFTSLGGVVAWASRVSFELSVAEVSAAEKQA